MNTLTIATQTTDTLGVETLIYCPQHPSIETQMRCNKCGKFICLKCAMQTPVGYRCRDCVHQQQKVYFNAKGHDDLVAFLVSLGMTILVLPVLAFVADSFYFGAFYLAFIAGPSAGALLAQLVRLAVQRRRSRLMRYFVVGGIVAGTVIAGIGVFVMLDIILFFELPILIFAFLAVTTGYQVLK